MKKTLILAMAILSASAAKAQLSEAEALAAIEANNPGLRAARLDLDAQMAQSEAETKMPDLELGGGYLWPGRKDFSVSQAIDWAVVSRQKRKTAAARDTLLAAHYAAARQETLLNARLAWIEATFQTALIDIHTRHTEAIGRIALAVQRRLDAGNARQIDANYAQLAYAAANRQLTLAAADRDEALLTLKSLNGGEPIDHAEAAFAPAAMPTDFETWYADRSRRAPSLKATAAQANVARAESREARLATAPQVAIGVMGEFSEDEKFKGVTLSMSLPLWRGSRARDAANLSAEAAAARHQAAAVGDRAEAETLWARTSRLRQAAQEFRAAVSRADNTELQAKALEAGEISVTEALEAAAALYSAEEEALEAERDFRVSLARLTAHEL